MRGRHPVDHTGKKYHRLTALRLDHTTHNGARWLCRCDCGKEKVVNIRDAQKGHTKSCGCLQKEIRPELGRRRVALLGFAQGLKGQILSPYGTAEDQEISISIDEVLDLRPKSKKVKVDKAHHKCSCGEDRADMIIRLRRNFYYCVSCGKEFSLTLVS